MASFMFQEDGSPAEVLFMDDTFGLTQYGYRLFSLMVRQEDGSGVPVAWLLTNGDDADRLTFFLKLVAENAENVQKSSALFCFLVTTVDNKCTWMCSFSSLACSFVSPSTPKNSHPQQRASGLCPSS